MAIKNKWDSPLIEADTVSLSVVLGQSCKRLIRILLIGGMVTVLEVSLEICLRSLSTAKSRNSIGENSVQLQY